jgi:hypothetical protein
VRARIAVVVFDRAPEPRDGLVVCTTQILLGCCKTRHSVLELRRALGDHLLEPRRVSPPLRLDLASLQRAGDVDQQLVRVEWLGEIPVRAKPERGIGQARVVVAGHHHGRHLRMRAGELLDELEAGGAGQPDVAEHDGERALGKGLARLLDVRDRHAVVARPREHAHDQPAGLLVVVDTEDRLAAHTVTSSAGRSSARRTALASSSGANGFEQLAADRCGLRGRME